MTTTISRVAGFAFALACAALLAVGAFALTGCGGGSNASKGSETLVGTFEGNAGTGYDWTCSIEDGLVCQVLESDVKSKAEGNVAGGPQEYTFTLSAVEGGENGTTSVTFHYARSWEQSPDDITAVWQVECKDGLLSITGYDGPDELKDALAAPTA